MAQQTNNGINFFYPDNPCYVFNVAPVRAVGTLDQLQLTISAGGTTYTVTYNVRNRITVDISEYLQSLFAGLSMGQDIDYADTVNVSELGKSVSITATALSGGTSVAQCSFTVFAVWGALMAGERLNAARKVTYFRGYPFSVGCYAPKSGEFYLDDGEAVQLATVQRGVYNIVIDSLDSDKARLLFSYDDGDIVAMDTVADIITEDVCDGRGIYLRWVDRHGIWNYWLFKQGNPTRNVASDGLWHRNNLDSWVPTYHWQGASGRRQSLTRNDVIPVCAPLVDSDTFDMLQDVTTSPYVDMYLGMDGGEPKWTAVTIEAGQYTKDISKQEQDFLMNIVLPEIPIQSL
jgi:hypothetical protein